MRRVLIELKWYNFTLQSQSEAGQTQIEFNWGYFLSHS